MSWMNSRVSPPLALPHRLDQRPKPGDEAVIADAQQRPARHVADAGGLDHDRARPAAREALVPVEHLGVTRPSSLARQGTMAGTQVRCAQLEAARRERREQPSAAALRGGGQRRRLASWRMRSGRPPHGHGGSGPRRVRSTAVASISTLACASMSADTSHHGHRRESACPSPRDRRRRSPPAPRGIRAGW